MVRIGPSALKYQGSGVGVLPRGRKVSVDRLMHGLLLVSGNDAGIALAGHVSGNERRFVRLMNRRARRLGLRCTHFSSAYGLQRSRASGALRASASPTCASRSRAGACRSTPPTR